MIFEGKALIISAPSGAGKTTLVRRLLEAHLPLGFSVSATSRPKRQGEVDGKDYYFLEAEQFRRYVSDGAFLEWEEVYRDQFYGTLKSELERIWKQNLQVIFDVDVKGGINIKKILRDKALSIFILPPSLEELRKRLELRGTEDDLSLQKRIAKAEFELGFSKEFDARILNNNLDNAANELIRLVKGFIESTHKTN